MLVIEGGDLVGKSTFVKKAFKLTEEAGLGHMPLHLTRPPRDFDYFQGYVSKMSRESIWDRFHLSCLAYRQHDDHPCSLTPVKWDVVEATFRLHCGFMVVVIAKDTLIAERHKARGDDMYDLEHILAVNKTFIDMANRFNVDVRGDTYHYRIDAVIGAPFTDDDVEKVVNLYLARFDEMSGE